MVGTNRPARFEITPAPREDEVAAIVAALARQRQEVRTGTDRASRSGRWGNAARPLLFGATGVDRWDSGRSWGRAARRA